MRRSAFRLIVPVAGLIVLLAGISAVRVSPSQFDAAGAVGLVGDSTAVDAETVEKGRAIFHGAGTCFMCHGQKLEGIVGPTLRAHEWRDAKGGDLPAIYFVVTHGVPNTMMVSHPGGISDAQAKQVASYVWAVSHDKTKP